jgi:hypothetical protein
LSREIRERPHEKTETERQSREKKGERKKQRERGKEKRQKNKRKKERERGLRRGRKKEGERRKAQITEREKQCMPYVGYNQRWSELQREKRERACTKRQTHRKTKQK